jgi:hypothetical protein
LLLLINISASDLFNATAPDSDDYLQAAAEVPAAAVPA